MYGELIVAHENRKAISSIKAGLERKIARSLLFRRGVDSWAGCQLPIERMNDARFVRSGQLPIEGISEQFFCGMMESNEATHNQNRLGF